MVKTRYIVIISLLVSTLMSTPTSALSADQRGVISTNCGSIQQTLQQLAKVDSRTRVFLGSAYENILSRFITPLNLRLVKNNQPSTTLTSIQSDFISGRESFNNSFTSYMQQLEELTSVDCKTNPDDFYTKLETTRAKRAELQKNVVELNSLLHDQMDAVTNLRETL